MIRLAQMTTKLTPMRFTEEDLVILDCCRDHIGVQSRSETVRAVLRAYARDQGLLLSTGHVLTSGHAAEKFAKAGKKSKKAKAGAK